jgi:hypothetical protein
MVGALRGRCHSSLIDRFSFIGIAGHGDAASAAYAIVHVIAGVGAQVKVCRWLAGADAFATAIAMDFVHVRL